MAGPRHKREKVAAVWPHSVRYGREVRVQQGWGLDRHVSTRELMRKAEERVRIADMSECLQRWYLMTNDRRDSQNKLLTVSPRLHGQVACQSPVNPHRGWQPDAQHSMSGIIYIVANREFHVCRWGQSCSCTLWRWPMLPQAR